MDRLPIFGKIIRFNRFSAPATWDSSSDYMEMFFESAEEFLNHMLNAFGYLSWEKICDCLGVFTTAEEIEAMQVLRKEMCQNDFRIARTRTAAGDEWILHLEDKKWME